ncbi:N-alpha-acetyltransferase 25, NatB auxiliary subunit [Trichinella nelsoni]|uniref:N-terminal acetyltransferase B complex subunit MDM20 homolog n=1 Tax=Trichinella nelsoni TaxID=6336 RepID=A0A0V0RIR8_9BILA|nr:N-alpha-acetyltransferase 25, NatB auxiliary subunit [Trichinella nelsoni]
MENIETNIQTNYKYVVLANRSAFTNICHAQQWKQYSKSVHDLFTLLDKGNVKRAIQDSDKFIKKYPQAPVAKALKTLCLIRYGRSGEADKLIEACFQCGPIDQLAMQALSYCFRELGKPHMLVVLYQRMLDQNPNNEDYMASLSLSHGRAGDFKMFGLQSMQLYKQVPNEKYYFWSVVSNVLQAHGQSESAMTLHLPLAQKMTVKYIKEHRNNINDNIIQLYLFILKMGSHHNEALRFLQSDLIQPEIHLKMYLAEEQLAVWERLGRHEEALEFSKERIRMKLTLAFFLDELTDGWPFWNKMIDNFLCLLEVNQERRKRLFENFVEFFNERIEERSSHLARLYLVEKLIEKNLATVDELESFKLDVPAKLIAKYFEAFAHKPCFFDDVRPFLKLVTESEKNDFVSELAKIIGDLPITFRDSQIDMSFIKNQDDVQRHVHLLHICSVIGCYANLSSLELVQFSKQLLILFDRARRSNTTQNSSGIYPSDGYLSLAVHFIWLLYIMKQDDHWLYRLAVLLEQRLSFGKPNYEFVFRLTKIYSLLGCPGALLRVFNGSDIKLIMMESLYMMNDQLTPWGFYREYVMWCTNCVEFYSRASRDIMDNMLVALREGNYLKSIEIFRFRDAYEMSANNLFCRIRRQYYHLISEFQDFETLRETFLRAMIKDALFAEDRLNWLDTVDRRDYRVISQYLSLEEVDSFHSWNKCVFAQMMVQTTFQWTVLRLFCSLHELYTLAEESSFCEIQADPASSSGSGSAGTGEPTLYMAHLKEDEPRPLRNALHHASQMRPIYADGISLDETQYEMVMYGSPVCYFGLYCRGHYFDLFELVLQTCLHYVQKAWLLVRGVESDDPRLKEDSSIFPPLDNLKQRLRTMFCDHQFKEDSDLFPHMQLVHISFLLETFSLCMLVCLAVKSIITLIYPHVTRKTKKKNSEGKSGLAQLNDNFADFCNVIALGTDTPFQMIADMQDLLEAESSLLRQSCTKWCEMMDMRKSAALFETNLRESYAKSLKYLFLLSTNHHSMAAMLLRSRGAGGVATGGAYLCSFEFSDFASIYCVAYLSMVGGQSSSAEVVEQLYRAVLSSDLDMLCSSGHFSVENLSMVYPYLLTRVFGVDIGRSLSPEGKNLLNKLVVDKRALEVFRMKLASVETPGKMEPPMIVELTTAGDGGLHFENCTPSQKLMLVRCEVAKGISAWHQARRTGTPVKQRSYCAADSERLVDDFADALFMLCYVADLMIRNAETSAEAYEERMWLIIRREKTLQYLCALTPECSSLFIRSAVEQLKLLGFVLQASMCYYSFEKLLSTLLQLIENNETLLWFFQFVKLSQKFIVRQAAKVRVTRELSAKITDVLPIDCVIALLHWRAFSRYQVHISDWIFKQLAQCCTPISETTVELIEMFVHSCLNLYIENENAPSSPVINPFAESKLIAFYKETALQTEHFVMQVLLLYYILYYENYYNENIRKFVQYIVIQIELHGRDYSALFIKILKCAVNLYSYLIFPLCLKIPRLASHVTIPSVDAIREAARCSKKFPKKSLAMLRKLRRCNPGGLFELLPELTDYARHLLDKDVAFALQQEYLSLWNYVELFYSRKLHGHTVASLKPSGTGVKFYSHTSLCDDIKQIVVCDERVFKVAPIFKILLRVLHCYFSAARLAVEQKIVINTLVGGGKRKPGRSSSTPAIFEENNTSVGESVRKYAILNEVLCIQTLLDSCMPDNEQISIEEREVLVHLCNFLHQVFIAEPMLIKAIHHQGYSTKLISIIVRNVPSMHVCFDWIKQLITMSDLQIKIFSVELLSHLCVEHPIEKAYRCAEFLLNVLYTMLDKLESKQVLLFYSKILQAVMRICRIFQSLVVLAYKLFDKACIIVNVNCGGAIPVLPMTNELKKPNQVEQEHLEAEEQSPFDAAVSDTTIITTAIEGRNLQTEKEQFLIQVRSAFQHFIGHGLIDIAD